MLGAAVVIDLDGGEVLAMASSPSFTRAMVAERPEEVFSDARRDVFVNRPIETPYPPGSVMKPVVLTSAITGGLLRLRERIRDDGYLLPDRRDIFRDWFYRATNGEMSHSALLGGPLDGAEAIARSSNVFFYTLGTRFGVDGVVDWFGRFGIGGAKDSGNGFGLRVYPGRVADKRDGTSAVLGDAIQMGIGQGPLEWTVLHAADSYATLGRGGVRLWPRLLIDEPVRGEDLELDPSSVDIALRGLRMVVEWEHGTGRHITYAPGDREAIFRHDGVTVWGKSGTAQAAARVWDREMYERTKADERVPLDGVSAGEHAWFCALVAAEGQRPRYAIAVVMERGGSGGRVSGPIASGIIAALRAEGYL